MNSRTVLALLILLGSLPLRGLAQTNLVQNGDFETGDLTAWTVNDPNAIFVSANAHGGNDAAWLGTYPGLVTGILSQDLSTLPGQQYQIDFFLANDYLQDPTLSSPSAFAASFGGISFFSQNPVSYQDYTEETALVTATSSTTTLAFSEQQEPGYFYLDDVRVTAQPASTLPPTPPSVVPDRCGPWQLSLIYSLTGLMLLRQQRKRSRLPKQIGRISET